MRGFDLSPLYRSTVGFDSFAAMLDRVAGFDNEATTYPPYNIERLAENDYRITMAVAGFGKDDIKIEVREDTLSIRGEKKDAETERTFLHRGIASRGFRAPLSARRPCRGDGRRCAGWSSFHRPQTRGT